MSLCKILETLIHVQGYIVSGVSVSTTVFGRNTNKKNHRPLFSLLFCSLTLAASAAAPVSDEGLFKEGCYCVLPKFATPFPIEACNSSSFNNASTL